MASDLQRVPDGYRRELDRLSEIEERLDAEVRIDDQRFAGLRDYRTVLAPRHSRRCRRSTTCAGCRCPTTSPS